MNKNDSEQSGSSAVLSEYFTPKSAMDESISDFQETKKRCVGPKNTAKSKSSKSKKAPKRIRGQKDIRTILQSTKNDLESYSKDFDKVCKKSGLDVDSEQLQLAIALSKSLQDTASTLDETSANSQTVNGQDRANKIRTTLQEYGFKVPEVKIPVNTRKARKRSKKYKLLLTSESQKKEIVVDKYSQLLFHNIAQCTVYKSDVEATNAPLYNLASNATYDILKMMDTFYVKNLIEKSTNTGNLLRDWSLIPGRPVSPQVLEHSNMNFSEIECSQDELDIVLSGSIKSCKNIIRNKSKEFFSDNSCKMDIIDDNNVGKITNNDHGKILKVGANTTNSSVNAAECMSTTNQYRSCSPDMFDDDALPSFENSKNSTVQNERTSTEINSLVKETKYGVVDLVEFVQIVKPLNSVCENTQSVNNVTKRKSNDLMDITECIQIQTKNITRSQLSQNSNISKRRSNDFMEITDCVRGLSEPIKDNIDLTQSPEVIHENTDFLIDKDSKNIDKTLNTNFIQETLKLTAPTHIEIDLTQSPENHEDETNNRVPKASEEDNPDERMDLTQSSDTSDELPFVSLTGTKSNSLEDTIIVDINEYVDLNKKTQTLQNQAEVHIDLTQYSGKISEVSNQSQSFFEEYIHDHSGNSEEPGRSIITQSRKRKSSSGCTNNYNGSKRSNFKDCGSHVNTINVDDTHSLRKTPSVKQNSGHIIVETETTELSHCDSDHKLCDSGGVDITCPINQSQGDEQSDIDLTQNSDISELSKKLTGCDSLKSMGNGMDIYEVEPDIDGNSTRYSILGKKYDFSIDYDDFLQTKTYNEQSNSKNTSSNSVVNEITDEDIQKLSKHASFISNCSQSSEVFEISDKELDFSIHQSKLEIHVDNFAFGGISIMDELSKFGTSKKSTDFGNKSVGNSMNEVYNETLPMVNIKDSKKGNTCKEISPIKHRRITDIATPQKACSSNVVTVVTPRNSELIIKTNNVTPRLKYELMSIAELHMELDKFGIKPFKRKRAIQLLTHIYNQTHPVIETCADELASPLKRRKLNDGTHTTGVKKLILPRKLLRPIWIVDQCDKCRAKNINKNIPETTQANNENVTEKKEDFDKGKASNVNKKRFSKRKGKNSSEKQKKTVPDNIDDRECIENRNTEIIRIDTSLVKDVECEPEDWVFQKREKAKVHSCRVPLHIAFYNYVSSRRDLREAILCYQPVEIDIIHKDLVGYGHRYDPKDLLKFLDKKCITVKTTDNDARNQRRS